MDAMATDKAGAMDKAAGDAGGQVLPCWSCKGPVEAGHPFCPTCEAVQAPGQADHFSRLGLAVSFDLDVTALDKRYFEMQRQLHPDRFATHTSRERALSQLQATSLNEAYEALKDPLHRAEYLVHLKGKDVLPEGCHLVNDQAVLMEAMELREALLEAETPEDVKAIAKRAGNDIDDCIARLSDLFANGDIEGACRLTTRLKYLRKLADETRVRKIQLADRL